MLRHNLPFLKGRRRYLDIKYVLTALLSATSCALDEDVPSSMLVGPIWENIFTKFVLFWVVFQELLSFPWFSQNRDISSLRPGKWCDFVAQ